MENNTSTIKRKKFIKAALIAVASIVLIGGIGYGTIAVLRAVKAPTLSDTPQTATPQTSPQPTITPEKAQTVADAAYEAGAKKAAEGDQKAALAEYKTAHKNYMIAQNTARADDAEFIIKSIEAVLAVPENPVKTDVTTSAKE